MGQAWDAPGTLLTPTLSPALLEAKSLIAPCAAASSKDGVALSPGELHPGQCDGYSLLPPISWGWKASNWETRKARGNGSEPGTLDGSRCRLFTSLSLSTAAAGSQTLPSFSFYLLSPAENCHPCSKVLAISAGKAAAAAAPQLHPSPKVRKSPIELPRQLPVNGIDPGQTAQPHGQAVRQR